MRSPMLFLTTALAILLISTMGGINCETSNETDVVVILTFTTTSQQQRQNDFADFWDETKKSMGDNKNGPRMAIVQLTDKIEVLVSLTGDGGGGDRQAPRLNPRATSVTWKAREMVENVRNRMFEHRRDHVPLVLVALVEQDHRQQQQQREETERWKSEAKNVADTYLTAGIDLVQVFHSADSLLYGATDQQVFEPGDVVATVFRKMGERVVAELEAISSRCEFEKSVSADCYYDDHPERKCVADRIVTPNDNVLVRYCPRNTTENCDGWKCEQACDQSWTWGECSKNGIRVRRIKPDADERRRFIFRRCIDPSNLERVFEPCGGTPSTAKPTTNSPPSKKPNATTSTKTTKRAAATSTTAAKSGSVAFWDCDGGSGAGEVMFKCAPVWLILAVTCSSVIVSVSITCLICRCVCNRRRTDAEKTRKADSRARNRPSYLEMQPHSEDRSTAASRIGGASKSGDFDRSRSNQASKFGGGSVINPRTKMTSQSRSGGSRTGTMRTADEGKSTMTAGGGNTWNIETPPSFTKRTVDEIYRDTKARDDAAAAKANDSKSAALKANDNKSADLKSLQSIKSIKAGSIMNHKTNARSHRNPAPPPNPQAKTAAAAPQAKSLITRSTGYRT